MVSRLSAQVLSPSTVWPQPSTVAYSSLRRFHSTNSSDAREYDGMRLQPVKGALGNSLRITELGQRTVVRSGLLVLGEELGEPRT
ncbi:MULTISPECIES: hypothetical protein [unclassified Kribbella]|uniref:hypothetical protein n=1 Tax=unclassified Kribbella TaxID=2644121 RepID=UPI0030780ABF